MADVPECRASGRLLRAWLSACVLLSFAASAAAGVCEPLMIQGTPAQCACSKKNWAAIDEQLRALDIESPQELASLVRTFLCRSGDKATASLRRSMPKLIATSAYATGEEGTSHGRVSRSEVTPLGGHAWDAGVSKEGAQVELSYAPNEACVASASFIHKLGGWLLVGIGDACD